jgi:hypothetical protein
VSDRRFVAVDRGDECLEVSGYVAASVLGDMWHLPEAQQDKLTRWLAEARIGACWLDNPQRPYIMVVRTR